MKITIEYDSIWQNSFLAGDDDQPISKENKREFIATSKSRNHVVKEITTNTVLGVLCRLIGEQRKLYQIRESEYYYFRDMENLITHQNKNDQITKETAFIVNKSDARPPQSTFIGVIPDDTKLFFSASAPQLWSVIYLELNNVMDFIKNDKVWECESKSSSMPRDLLSRIDEIKNIKTEHGAPVKTVKKEIEELTKKINKEKDKQKKLVNKFQKNSVPNVKQKKSFDKKNEEILGNIAELNKSIVELKESKCRNQLDEKLKSTVAFLDKKYPNMTEPNKTESYLKDGILYRIQLYAAALYLQAERMHQNKISVNYCLNEKSEIFIRGFSKRGFNGIREFINPLTGSNKKTVGTPFPLTKASGTLQININVDRDKAKEIKMLIENAGVSSFYLGKKGLAYVTDIDTREVRH